MNDYLIDYETRRMQVRNGDFVVGDATKQHQRSLIMNHKGEYKQHLTTGAGAADYLDDENPDELIRELRRQLVQDGQTVNDIVITATGLGVDASYK
jgi:DNA-binding response OmpR family regulator